MTDAGSGVSRVPSIPWFVAAVLAVAALIGGVFLGRVAFFTNEEPRPLVTNIEVLDTTLKVNGSVEFLRDEDIYILRINDMPPAPAGSAYQVWVQTDDITVSAGVWNPNAPRMAYAAYNGRYTTMIVTLEPSPRGSAQPTTDPVISVDLTAIEIDE